MKSASEAMICGVRSAFLGAKNLTSGVFWEMSDDLSARKRCLSAQRGKNLTSQQIEMSDLEPRFLSLPVAESDIWTSDSQLFSCTYVCITPRARTLRAKKDQGRCQMSDFPLAGNEDFRYAMV